MSWTKKTRSPLKPLVAYYQFNEPTTPNDKVRVLSKGEEIVGLYQHTFMQKDPESGELRPNAHVVDTKEGPVTVKACKSINDFFADLAKGSRIKIVYQGKGKKNPKFPLRKPAHLFDVYLDETVSPAPAAKAAKTTKPPVDDQDDAQEEFDEEQAF